MKKLLQFITAFLLLSSTVHAQNVGIGTNTPTSKLHVVSTTEDVASFNGPDLMYIILREAGFYRGYIGSFSGAAADVDFGTGAGNTSGKVHLTIQAQPKLTVDADGNTDIAGELNRSVKTGNANLVPVAYGNISSSAGVLSGSGNITASRVVTGIYQVGITGESYQFQQYITVVTPVGSTVPVIATTGSGGGLLQIFLYNIAGAAVDANFHFVVYKQ